jgi:hypothetical protein
VGSCPSRAFLLLLTLLNRQFNRERNRSSSALFRRSRCWYLLAAAEQASHFHGQGASAVPLRDRETFQALTRSEREPRKRMLLIP